eukprot:NODE_292_length_11597_cov_0.265177.p3 type:complete len:409 gc:universal NODE_292_length_11597_cov_0.265177:10121-11347(+)
MLDLVVLFVICISLTLDPSNIPKSLRKYSPSPSGCPEERYSIVFDAGSTGSRVHVYQFCGELKSEVFEQVKPGLSKLGPDLGGESLIDLLQIAHDRIPRNLHHCTPIQLQATAGLRLLPDNGLSILTSLKSLFALYPFLILDIKVMSGLDEALFAWLTVNYLAENFRNTAAIIDLGGASTQIVFEHADHTTSFKFQKDFNLYANSFLGYGLHSAIDTVRESLGVSENPCLGAGQTDDFSKNAKRLTFYGPPEGTARGKICRDMIRTKLFLNHRNCDKSQTDPCRMNVHFPDISEFKNDLYAFSYIYDLVHLEGMSAKDVMKVSEIIEIQNELCDFSKTDGLIRNLDKLRLKEPMACMQLSYVVELLTTGYGLNPDRKLHIIKKLKDMETGWALGAALKSLDVVESCNK